MNNAGVLLDELGFTPGLVEPLVNQWLQPLCATLHPLAEAGGRSLDHHKSFVVRRSRGIFPRRQPRALSQLESAALFSVPLALHPIPTPAHRALVPAARQVRYRLGEDEQLSAHFDNSEVTVNVNLGRDFVGGCARAIPRGAPHLLASPFQHPSALSQRRGAGRFFGPSGRRAVGPSGRRAVASRLCRPLVPRPARAGLAAHRRGSPRARSELVFYGNHDQAPYPTTYHEWSAAGVGHGVLHVGANVHAALPIEEGERLNLVIWMRSTDQRRVRGCPMCRKTDRLLGM